MSLFSKNFFYLILRFFPVLLLFFLVLGDFTFSFHAKKLVTFNLVYVVIYFWVLKKPEMMSYGLVFLAGIINDIVTGFPIGISSLNYLLICGFAAYFRNITLRPRLIQDWLFFLFTILVINSLSYTLLILFFSVDLNYIYLIINTLFTFLFYVVFANIFEFYYRIIFKDMND